MRSNFDDPLKFDDDGKLEVCGPLEWNGETEVAAAVVINQRGKKVFAMDSSPPHFHPGDHEWMFKLDPRPQGQSFEAAPAHAIGVLCAVRNGTPELFLWTQDVRLEAE
jgi:hypothetical protein